MRVTTNHYHNLTPATPRLLSGVHPVQIKTCRSSVSGSCIHKKQYLQYRPATKKPSFIMSATDDVEPQVEALVLAPEVESSLTPSVSSAVDPRAAQSRLHRGPRLPGHKRSLALHIAYVGTSFQGGCSCCRQRVLNRECRRSRSRHVSNNPIPNDEMHVQHTLGNQAFTNQNLYLGSKHLQRKLEL